MESHISQIKALYDEGDDVSRARIKEAPHDLINTFEGPMGLMWQTFGSFFHLAILRTGVDLNLFSHLVNSKEPQSATELAEKTGASPELLKRLLRYLASVPLVIENDTGSFSATEICHILANPAGEGLLIHAFDTICPPLQALPSFLASNGYQAVNDSKNTPFQQAFYTKLPAFEFIAQPGRERQYTAFQKSMTAFQSASWIDGLAQLNDAAEAAEQHETPFLVDVGGGHGHQCVQLLNKYPALKDRVVLQDLPEAVGKLGKIDGVQVTEQDFFKEQSVKGAKYYYLRRILHDWPDSESRLILRNLALAMNGDSRILVDEVSFPDSKVNWRAALQDIAMMVQLGGNERTRSEWVALVEGVKPGDGRALVVDSVHEYDKVEHGCITVLKLRYELDGSTAT